MRLNLAIFSYSLCSFSVNNDHNIVEQPTILSGKRKATDDKNHTGTTTIDFSAGAGEKHDNDHDEVDSDIDSSSSESQVLISQMQQDESGGKQVDPRFKRRKTAKFKKHPDAPKRFRRCVERPVEVGTKSGQQSGGVETTAGIKDWNDLHFACSG